MTEQSEERWPHDAGDAGDPDSWDDAATPERPDRTGVESVDAVMDAVAGLSDRPLEEHVAVFETAHAELRRTLDS